MKKLIDDKGRIFGIINIIDLFIILAVVFVGGYAVLKYARPVVTEMGNPDNITLTFFCELAADYAVDNLEIGGIVEDDTKNISFGNVTDFTVNRGIIYTQDAMGNQVKAEAENYSSLEIKSLAKGQLIPNGGVRINGNVYTIGHTVTIRAGKSKFYSKLSGFEKAQ